LPILKLLAPSGKYGEMIRQLLVRNIHAEFHGHQIYHLDIMVNTLPQDY